MSGCGSGSCACASTSGSTNDGSNANASATLEEDRPAPAIARANGVPLHKPGEALSEDELRQRACTELLRQQAMLSGLLADSDPAGDDGVTSAAASSAIEALLALELALPVADEAACKRHYEAHLGQYRQGERVHARHILFAVTPGVDVTLLRKRAEAALIEVRADPPAFAGRAEQLSNCPSGAEGGSLGWLTSADVAPEFGRELFGKSDVGVLPRLVHSRFGLHVVEVLAREGGLTPPFNAVRGAVEQALNQQSFATALRQYLQLLAGRAALDGVSLAAADSPLTQ